MASWETRIIVPDNSKVEVYRSTMNLIYRVSKLSRVPRNANWRCIKRNNSFFFYAEWVRGTEQWLY